MELALYEWHGVLFGRRHIPVGIISLQSFVDIVQSICCRRSFCGVPEIPALCWQQRGSAQMCVGNEKRFRVLADSFGCSIQCRPSRLPDVQVSPDVRVFCIFFGAVFVQQAVDINLVTYISFDHLNGLDGMINDEKGKEIPHKGIVLPDIVESKRTTRVSPKPERREGLIMTSQTTTELKGQRMPNFTDVQSARRRLTIQDATALVP